MKRERCFDKLGMTFYSKFSNSGASLMHIKKYNLFNT